MLVQNNFDPVATGRVYLKANPVVVFTGDNWNFLELMEARRMRKYKFIPSSFKYRSLKELTGFPQMLQIETGLLGQLLWSEI